MAYFQPMDLYYCQWQMAAKAARNAKKEGNENEYKKWKAIADNAWEIRESNMKRDGGCNTARD